MAYLATCNVYFQPDNIMVIFLYLQWEGESQISLHRPTGWQHYLMGPQNPFGALEKNKK